MKNLKTFLGAIVLATLSTAGAYLQHVKTNQNIYSDISLVSLTAYLNPENNGSNPESGEGGNTETGGGFSEWWNRKDYDCIDVTCVTFLLNYKSNVAAKVADGTGHVAHSWECTGCSGNGYIVGDQEKS